MKMLIKHGMIMMVLVSLLALNIGCVGVGFYPVQEERGPRGEYVEKEMTVEPYTKIAVSSSVTLHYVAEDSPIIKIAGYEHRIAEYDISVKDGTLIVKNPNQGSFYGGDEERLELTISTKKLEEIRVDGGLLMENNDTIQGDSLILRANGGVDLGMDLDVDRLEIHTNGGGEYNLSGRADQTEISINGAGTIEAFPLQTKEAKIDIGGAGDVEISCSELLEVSINGAGEVAYQGDPKVIEHIGGSGSVSKK